MTTVFLAVRQWPDSQEVISVHNEMATALEACVQHDVVRGTADYAYPIAWEDIDPENPTYAQGTRSDVAYMVYDRELLP